MAQPGDTIATFQVHDAGADDCADQAVPGLHHSPAAAHHPRHRLTLDPHVQVRRCYGAGA